ncbi:MAG: ABC transporter permease [Myxococcota bacterium]|nr:ABC transporter permease [Myxococcota bacterium]
MNPIGRALMMLVYHLRHAARSLSRTPGFTFVMELSLGLGVALWTVARTAIDSQANVTIAKSDQIYLVEIQRDMLVPVPTENHDPNSFWDHVPGIMLTHRDATAIAAQSGRAHTVSFFSPLLVSKAGGPASNLRVRFTTSPIFTMFDHVFTEGAPWTDDDEAQDPQVCVITQQVAERWFGNASAVGAVVRISGHDFRVVGVVYDSRTERKLYDFTAFPDTDSIYVPLSAWGVIKARPVTYYTWGGPAGSYDELTSSETGFLQMFVELPNARAVLDYQKVLADYVAAERETNRAPKIARPTLRPLEQWATMLTATPFVLFQLFGGLAFVACVFNLVRLLIAKFSARANEVAIRRALGAPRGTIFFQHLLEAELVSCGGAVLGLLLATGGIAMLNSLIIDRPVDFSLDTRRVLLAAASAVLAGLVAGIYPAWRICNTQPASVLRRQ